MKGNMKVQYNLKLQNERRDCERRTAVAAFQFFEPGHSVRPRLAPAEPKPARDIFCRFFIFPYLILLPSRPFNQNFCHVSRSFSTFFRRGNFHD
jgi:hypothetical protein